MRLLLLILLVSCSSPQKNLTSLKDQSHQFAYQDSSGSFRLTRELKLVDKKIVLRQLILNKDLNQNEFLEKTIVVQQIGSHKRKKNKMIKPVESQYAVWLDGKKHESRGKIYEASRSYNFSFDDGSKINKVSLPKAPLFCFFSLIPECLKAVGVLDRLERKPNQSIRFYIIWESFPYIFDQMTNLTKNGTTQALASYDGFKDETHRLVIEVEGQSIFYHFTKDFDFARMFWGTQGISIMPVAEAEE